MAQKEQKNNDEKIKMVESILEAIRNRDIETIKKFDRKTLLPLISTLLDNYSFQKLQITDMISQLNIEYQKLERETLFLENLLAILSSQNSNQEIKEEEKELTLEEIEND